MIETRPAITGLSDYEAARLLRLHGPNTLPETAPDPLWRQVAAQFTDPLIITLLVSAVIAAAVGAGSGESGLLARFGDSGAIMLIVLLNAFLGVHQERRASDALAALRSMAAPHARILRGGEMRSIAASALVPGDVLVLESGDVMAADASVLESSALAMQEAALTGESVPVFKDESDAALYAGTQVVAGRALAVVTATGTESQMGRIGQLMRSVDASRTPLQLRLDAFGRIILRACLGIAAVLFIWGWWRGGTTMAQLLLEAVSLAVAAIPEGLPAITTIALALGMMRMAKQGALVRRLSAVETLGAATVICTDKTGTLTRNEMKVMRVFSGDEGERALLESCVLSVARETDPMEAALIACARDKGVDVDALREARPRLDEIPFDAVSRRSSVKTADGAWHTKGAVEVMLAGCRLDGSAGKRVVEEAERMASDGLRVLLVARDDCFLGLVGLLDPPRDGAAEAVRDCRRAGIRAVMITGDHPATAAAVARTLGMTEEGETCVSGADLDAMSDAALAERVDSITVFARATPEQKLRIVRALKARGHVVAMTGDGVNDAPALREAHIGVAMGRHGTDVAREAADLVLADDNFSTIVKAIAEGRAIYRNIQKFIFFLLSSNLGLVAAVFIVSLYEWPLLTPLMILWINLVTNGLPALALGVDPTEPVLMSEPPRPARQPLLILRDYAGMLFVGAVMGLAGVAVYFIAPPAEARTMSFCVLALAPLVHAFSCRSPHASAFHARWSPILVLAVVLSAAVHLLAVLPVALRPVFHTVALSGTQWLWVVGLSLLVLPAVEMAKLAARARYARLTPCSGGPRTP